MSYIDKIAELSNLKYKDVPKPYKPNLDEHTRKSTRTHYQGKGDLVGMSDIDLDLLMTSIVEDESGTYIKMMKDILVLAKIEFGEKIESRKANINEQFNEKMIVYEKKVRYYEELQSQPTLEEIRATMLDIMDNLNGPNMTNDERTIIGAYIYKGWQMGLGRHLEKHIAEDYQKFLGDEERLTESFKEAIANASFSQFQIAGDCIKTMIEAYQK